MTDTALNQLIDRVHELSPLPSIARRVMTIAEDDRFSAYDLASVISADQALTAKLLKLSNSAYYGFPRRIATVRDAVILLGFREVKVAAMATSLLEFGPRTSSNSVFSVDLFWGHAIATAIVSEVLAKETGLASPDEAYTAGMLHDVGQMILNAHEPRFASVVSRSLAMQRSLPEVEFEEFGFTHADVGRTLAERWQFPPQLVDAIGLHHQLDITKDRHPLSYVVAQANLICHEYGLWCGVDLDDDAVAANANAPHDATLAQAALRALGGHNSLAQRVHSFLTSTVGEGSLQLHRSVMAAIAVDDTSAAPGA